MVLVKQFKPLIIKIKAQVEINYKKEMETIGINY